MFSRFVDEDSILYEYENVTEILPERTVAKPTTNKFHRPDPEERTPTPACGCQRKSDDWSLFDTSSALAATIEPCRACFGPVLQHLAADPDSPVEYRDGNEPVRLDTDGVTERLGEGGRGQRDPPLVTRTEKVAIPGAAGSKYHAPSVDGTVCGLRGLRVVDRDRVEDQYRPCQKCFTELDEEVGTDE